MPRAAASELFPLYRSHTQARLLAYVLLSPDQERTVGEIASAIGASLSTTSKELDRLVRAGLLHDRRFGPARLVRANLNSPLVPPTTELSLRTYGPTFVVEQEFRELSGVAQVLIFGSWAARYLGVAGSPPADIDVLVVGRPDRDAMYEAAQRAEQRIGRPVNTTVRSATAWEQATDRFIQQLKQGPLVQVLGAAEAVDV